MQGVNNNHLNYYTLKWLLCTRHWNHDLSVQSLKYVSDSALPSLQ